MLYSKLVASLFDLLTSVPAFSTLVAPTLVRSMAGKLLQMEYCVIVLVFSNMASVRCSCAGPPFSQLYLIPKSSSGPPGL
jgi:hypothetical protein